MQIALTKGYFTEIDDEDFHLIKDWSWFANVNGNHVRAMRMADRRGIYMHQQILNEFSLFAQGLEIDHIDGNPLNNRRGNLRIVTHTQNMRNTERHRNFKGYCYNKRAKLWYCYIHINGVRKNLGYTKTEAEAIARVAEARCG